MFFQFLRSCTYKVFLSKLEFVLSCTNVHIDNEHIIFLQRLIFFKIHVHKRGSDWGLRNTE